MELAERYRRVAGGFTERALAVPVGAWDNPAPCEGWVARDVVRHLVEWLPAFVREGGGPVLPSGPPVDDAPAGAWRVMSDGIQALLDSFEGAATPVSHPRAGTHSFEDTIATFFLGDVLVHTWVLARATGLDETLDAGEVAALYAGMEPLDDVLRASGQYGPRVPVAADADVQTKLLAFTGRRP
jgi:uncharacterized protein (TIGR03086 family)